MIEAAAGGLDVVGEAIASANELLARGGVASAVDLLDQADRLLADFVVDGLDTRMAHEVVDLRDQLGSYLLAVEMLQDVHASDAALTGVLVRGLSAVNAAVELVIERGSPCGVAWWESSLI